MIHCKLGKRVRTESELSDSLFTKYLVNSEVISKKRLHREQNIYANIYKSTKTEQTIRFMFLLISLDSLVGTEKYQYALTLCKRIYN